MLELGLRLLKADSERDVSDIVHADPEMLDNKNWHPIDDSEQNNNIVGNQSPEPAKALVELITKLLK